MERTYIKDLRGKLDQTVKLQGWLQTLRDQKKMQFLILRDPTGLVQVAHWKPNNEELAARIASLSAETALTITGKVAGASYAEGLEKKPTFLNLDNPFPIDPALIVINQDRRPLFGEPEKSLLGKTISVTGIVQKSESGRAVIDLIWPSQLRVEP